MYQLVVFILTQYILLVNKIRHGYFTILLYIFYKNFIAFLPFVTIYNVKILQF